MILQFVIRVQVVKIPIYVQTFRLLLLLAFFLTTIRQMVVWMPLRQRGKHRFLIVDVNIVLVVKRTMGLKTIKHDFWNKIVVPSFHVVSHFVLINQIF